MYCKQCGASIGDNVNFCTQCGRPLTQQETNSTAEQPKQPAESPQVASAQGSQTATQRSAPCNPANQQTNLRQQSQLQQQQHAYQQQTHQQSYCNAQPIETVYAHSEQTTTLALIAFVLAIIGTVSIGWTIIPLAWMIPMTVHTWGIYKGKKPNTTGFGVCTLLFLNMIGGILLLVADKDR